jgi:polyisoprenoid-binding protein YceI
MRQLVRSAALFASALVASVSLAAEGGAFGVDKVHSMVVFKIGHMGVANFYGVIHAPEGSYLLDAANPSASKLEIKVPVENLDSGNEARDKHLKGPDFFDSKQNPDLTFVGKSFNKTGDKTFDVTGDLTLRGVTKPVTAKIVVIGEGPTKQGYKSGFEATFTIKRSEFGMTKYLEENAIGDEVAITVSIEGKRD